MAPDRTALVYNNASYAALAPYTPKGTTLHFTFGSAVMLDFVKNWLHFAHRAGLAPLLVGAADTGVHDFCTTEGVRHAHLSG